MFCKTLNYDCAKLSH